MLLHVFTDVLVTKYVAASCVENQVVISFSMRFGITIKWSLSIVSPSSHFVHLQCEVFDVFDAFFLNTVLVMVL